MSYVRLVRSAIGVVTALLALAPLSTNAQVFTISGTVTNNIGTPLDSADVLLFDDQGTPIGIPPTVTDPFGVYTIANVSNGMWQIKIEPRSAHRSMPLTQNVTVAGSNAVLNFVLPPGNLVTGFVRDVNGFPIPNIDLNVRDRNTGDRIDTPGDNTDIFGFYDIVVPNGLYRISYRDVVNRLYLTTVLDDVPITSDTMIDVTLFLGATISGTVQTTLGAPIVNVDLDFIDVSTGQVVPTSNDKTDVNGNYTVTLPVGQYDIEFEPPVATKTVAKEVFGVDILTDIVLNVMLESGFSISGIVRNSSGIGVAGADIDVRDTLTGLKVFTPFDNTDATGHYDVIVPAGTYDIAFQPPLASRLAPVELLANQITSDAVFNVTVQNGFLLSATVIDNLFFPLSGVDIDLIDAFTGVKVALTGDKTAADGTVSVVAVPSTYILDVQPPLTLKKVARRIMNVVLSSDITLPVIVLDDGIILSGTVTDSLGTPVSKVDIDAILTPVNDTILTPSDKSDIFGHYDIVIPTGVFNLLYKPDSLSAIVDTVTLNNIAINIDTTINVSFQSSMPECCVGLAGNVDNDPGDVTDIADLTVLIDHLFITFPPLACPAEGNIDGDPAGVIDIADLTALIDHLFINFPPTAPCR